MFSHDQYLNFAIFQLNSTLFQEVVKLLKLNHFLKKLLDGSSKLSLYFIPPPPTLPVIKNH